MEVQKYLHNKFDEEMIFVSGTRFSFIDQRSYSILVSPKNNQEIVFEVGQNINDRTKLYDYYSIVYWRNVASRALNDELSMIYPAKLIEGRFMLENVPKYLDNPQTITNYKFEEIKDKISGKIYIDIQYKFKDFQTESQKIMKIIQLIKEKKYQIEYLTINYAKESGRFAFYDYELVEIRDTEDLLKYSDKYSY
jgi:hypothetical protein